MVGEMKYTVYQTNTRGLLVEYGTDLTNDQMDKMVGKLQKDAEILRPLATPSSHRIYVVGHKEILL